MEKRKFNKEKLFIFISIIFLVIYVLFYGIRFVYYYIEEHPKTSDEEGKVVYLSDKITSGITLDSKTKGLFFDEETKEYYFKGDIENNYVYYSGRVWRIISVNEDNEIKLISNESQTLLNKTSSSYIDNWLNEIFITSLKESDKYLVNTKVYNDKITSLDNITKSEIKEDELIGLLSIYEYDRSGAATSFLNNSSYFWLSNDKDDKTPWYIFDKGGVNSAPETDKFYGVRPVITLKSKLTLNLGDGTEDDPYFIEDKSDGQLKNRSVGEYFKYADYVWRILEVGEEKVKAVMDGYIMNNDTEFTMAFSTKASLFDTTDKKGLAYYLNNTFYNSITKDYNHLVEGNFNINKLNISTYDYKTAKKEETKTYVGLLSIEDYFIGDYNDIYLINSSDEANNLVYSINNNGVLYADKFTEEKKIRPVIYVDASLYALGQDGNKINPYVIGR